MADGKKRRGYRAYLDDYQALADGQIVYTGKVYSYAGPTPWKRELSALWLRAGVCLVCAGLCGALPVSGMVNTFYVILPWLLAFIGAGATVWALCRMTHHGERMEEHVLKATVGALPVRAAFTVVCAAAAVLGQAMCLILGGTGPALWADVCFFPLMALAAAAAAGLYPRSKALRFEMRP